MEMENRKGIAALPVIENDTELILKWFEESAEEDPLSRDQILSSIRAAKKRRLPTATALKAVRRQIDVD